MGFGINSDPPPPTAAQGKMHGFRSVPCTRQKYNFFCKVVFLLSFWVGTHFGGVPILAPTNRAA